MTQPAPGILYAVRHRTMKGFLLGLVMVALAGVGYVYWKERSAATLRPSVADAGAPVKVARDRRRRRRRGALRIARNDTFGGSDTFGGELPERRTGPGQALPGNEPSERPVAGGSATTEVGPEDVLGGLSSPQPGAGRRAADEAPAPEPIKLSAADLRMVARGDDLSPPAVTHLDMSSDDGAKELSQDEIDARFRAKEDAILACIARSRPDEDTWVPGHVTVAFRIQRTGGVHGVRVEAPAILQKGGLYGCIKGVVSGIRFSPSSGSQVITYPFSLT